MSANHRKQLSLLAIPPGHLYQPQSHVPLYSPAIPSAFHQGFPSPFPPQSLLQTPMQPSFFPPPSGAPPRPIHQGHRAQASIALAAAGILPPPGVPVPPLAQNQFTPPFGGPQFPPFQPRSRRQPSMSTGGPPKAQLGGAGKNYKPPSPTAVALASATTQNQKAKKVVVSLPKETASAVDGMSPERVHFARTPIPPHLVPPQSSPSPPDVVSAIMHPDDSWRMSIPDTVDVFLPARPAWEDLRKKFIEEKLEKLGVEKGSGSSSNVPHIHAPHARAASISSPADPALLFFKLNKLQQAQNSQVHSASVSPQPSIHSLNNATPPPLVIQPQLALPLLKGAAPLRHGHSLSLAAAPFTPSRPYMAVSAPVEYNSLGHGTFLAPDGVRSPDTRSDPGAPTDKSLAPPTMPVRADSRPDFALGFGLDVPEETDEELEQEQEQAEDEQDVTEENEEEPALAEASHIALADPDDMIDMELDVDEADAEVGSITTAAQSRVHSRHVSRLSATLSLLTVGGHVSERESDVDHDEESDEREGDLEDDAIGEWTGSEDLRTGTEATEDEESIGEWSNPSDEERARRERQQRRVLRRAHLQPPPESSQVPRRIPNFPHPPVNPLPLTSLLSQPRPDAEEDMISNPSDDSIDHPPVRPFHPSSRQASLSLRDPVLVHSRHPSNNVMPTPFQLPMPIPIQAPIPKRTDILNPHAKPFVLAGASRHSGSFTPVTLGPQMPQQPQLQQQPHMPQPHRAFGHIRGASLGRPLNAGAPEFKPGTFAFTPPPNMPKFPVPQPQTAPPALPSPPPVTDVDAGFIRTQQGREKRQRLGSVDSVPPTDAGENGRSVMTSFKFPQESPLRKAAPPSPSQRQGIVCPPTLPGLGGIDFGATKESALNDESPVSEGPRNDEVDGDEEDDTGGEADRSGDMEHELPVPLSMKARRAPIPLDFKHPVSTNTVPAGLFKALANGPGSNGSSTKESEERTRRIVRSRLNSREIFEHVSRPSLDDLCVPAISQNASRGRLVTDPGRWDTSAILQEPPQPARDRRASLPTMTSARSSFSDGSGHPQDIARRLELQQYEERLEALLESKLDDFREEVRALRLEAGANGGMGSTSTDTAINEVVSLFRAQLQESAARGLDDSQVDARGELDFQLVKDVVEQGHAEARAMIQQDLDRILRRVEALQSAEVTPIHGPNTEAMLEEYHARTRNTVVGAVAPITARLEALERTRTRTPLPPPHVPMLDHEVFVRELHAKLVPHIVATRAEPIDYELLTEQLSQAVKPHISQLIDLASDKRETAGLIVDRLIPVLPTIYPPAGDSFDIPTVVAQITAEVRRVAAPLDTHEIKEQVSDLVVERLDSRMAVRDRALDGLSTKLVDGLDRILEPVNDVASRVVEVSKGQEALSVQTRDLASANNDAMALLSGLPEQLSATMEPLRNTLADLISTVSTTSEKSQQQPSPSAEDLFRIYSSIDSLSSGQQTLQGKATELLALHQNVLSRLAELPDNMAIIVKAAQVAQAELLARTATKEDFEEVRQMMATNADLQVQLAKARAQYGAVRAEKDIVMDRITSAEEERDQLRAKVDEIQAVMLLRATDAATSQARTTELEEAVSQSLARLKTSDVTIESQKERLLELETLNRELTAEKQGLVSQVHSLESQAGFASRDKGAAVEALTALRMEHDALLTQQTHWEDFRRTTEKLEHLSALVSRSQTNETELKELRRMRDRSKVLESEHAALQQRYQDQENRAVEWEQRADESEAALAEMRVALENAEDRATQLVEEHFEARAAEERLARERENKLRDQVAALEARLAQLQFSSIRATKTAALAAASSPPRPDSRASTIYPSRSATPTASVTTVSRTNTPPMSVRDSIHAPRATAAAPRKQGPVPRTGRFGIQDWSSSRVASPTPSVVSVTRTNDGWYE